MTGNLTREVFALHKQLPKPLGINNRREGGKNYRFCGSGRGCRDETAIRGSDLLDDLHLSFC